MPGDDKWQMAEIRRDLFFAGMPAIWRLYMAVK